VGEHQPLGRLAVSRGYVTEEQLQRVLETQRRQTPEEHDVVVRLGFLAPEDVAEARRRFAWEEP
jgi:hypothetical protein